MATMEHNQRRAAPAARLPGPALVLLALALATLALTSIARAGASNLARPLIPVRALAKPISPARAASLGQQAYLYGFPLLEFLRVRRTETSVRCPTLAGDAPLNSFSNVPVFANPSARTVVAPNVDTLYSIAQLDLGRGPVILSHPAMGRRYFVFELLDPYTNVIAYIGSRTTGAARGRFAITWSGHPGRQIPGARVVRSAYRRVWVIGRTLASDRADQLRAYALMRHYGLTPPGGPRHFAKACRPGLPKAAATPQGLAFLDALSTALAQNPPPARDRALLRRLAAVGVEPGLTPQRAHLSPAALQALVSRVTTVGAALPAIARAQVLQTAAKNHGWSIPAADIGRYGTDYRYRAGVAVVGLGANTQAEAMYPTALTDSAGAPLTGASSYRLVFAKGHLPPVRAFWSLTMYDAAGYLVPNSVKRYAVGSTHPPLVRAADGSIVIVIQPTRPTARGVNWLPAPPGPFRLSMRLYWPKAAALGGRWRPPLIQRTSAAASTVG